MQPACLIFSMDEEKRRVELGDEPCRVGRGAQNTIVLQSELVSRNHAMVHKSESNAYLLFDLGSRNGTLLNGRRLAAPAELRDGDVIKIGNHTMTFSWPRGADGLPGRWALETAVCVTPRSTVVMVADLRDFTRLSAELGEVRIAEIIGAFNRRAGAVLESSGVWTHKFIGDAVMAVWSVGLGEPGFPMLQAAFSVVPEIAEAVRELSVQFALHQPLEIGFGVNTGIASVGNLGSSGAADHTALGDVVNKAFRLEASTRIIPADLAFSQEVHSVLARIGIDQLGTKRRLVLKGYPAETDVYAFSLDEVQQLLGLLKQHAGAMTQQLHPRPA